MNNPVEITISLSEKEYRQMAYFNVFFKSRSFLFFMPFIVAWSLGVIIIRWTGALDIGATTYIGALTILGLLVLMVGSTEWNIRRYLKSDQFAVAKPRKLRIDDQGIYCETPELSANALYQWPMIYRAYEIKGYFLIYFNIQQAFCLPKSQMTESQREDLRRLLLAHLENKFERRTKE